MKHFKNWLKSLFIKDNEEVTEVELGKLLLEAAQAANNKGFSSPTN